MEVNNTHAPKQIFSRRWKSFNRKKNTHQPVHLLDVLSAVYYERNIILSATPQFPHFCMWERVCSSRLLVCVCKAADSRCVCVRERVCSSRLAVCVCVCEPDWANTAPSIEGQGEGLIIYLKLNCSVLETVLFSSVFWGVWGLSDALHLH